MELVVIFGPTAVGKMTVGQALARKTGFRLFHNHMTIDTLMPVFDWGSSSLKKLVPEFRYRVMEEAAEAKVDLIHTFVWGFGNSSDTDFMAKVKDKVESQGGRVSFVELQAPLSIRKERNGTENRAVHKPLNVQRGPEHIEVFEKSLVLSSGGKFPFPESYLFVENSTLGAEEVADKIIGRFGFKRT